nr:hypothetical protein [Tanacetum cinerariifolium]
MSTDVTWGHSSDGGGDDRPPPYQVDDRETLMPLSDHAAHWANYLGELVRELHLHHPSWRQMLPERKAGVVAKIGCKKLLTKQVNMIMRLFRSDGKFSQMLTQLESQPEYGGGSGSGGCEDDKPGDDEDGGEDEEEEDDS